MVTGRQPGVERERLHRHRHLVAEGDLSVLELVKRAAWAGPWCRRCCCRSYLARGEVIRLPLGACRRYRRCRWSCCGTPAVPRAGDALAAGRVAGPPLANRIKT